MKYYILSFIGVMCISCALAGGSNSRSYQGVGIESVSVDDTHSMSAQKQDNLVGEMILVDMNRPHHGGASVKDVKT